MKTLKERYYSDSQFKALVDMMVSHINNCNYTPSEMREAAVLASIIYEEINIDRRKLVLVEHDVEEALRVIRQRVVECQRSGNE